MRGKVSTKATADRRCSNCVHKLYCDVFLKNGSELTLSGWDKNRFAMSCCDYKEEYERY